MSSLQYILNSPGSNLNNVVAQLKTDKQSIASSLETDTQLFVSSISDEQQSAETTAMSEMTEISPEYQDLIDAYLAIIDLDIKMQDEIAMLGDSNLVTSSTTTNPPTSSTTSSLNESAVQAIRSQYEKQQKIQRARFNEALKRYFKQITSKTKPSPTIG